MSKVTLLLSNTGNCTPILAVEEFLQFLNLESRILMSHHLQIDPVSPLGNEQVPKRLLEAILTYVETDTLGPLKKQWYSTKCAILMYLQETISTLADSSTSEPE